MPQVEVTRQTSQDDMAAVEELLAVAEAAVGQRLDLVAGAVGLVARLPDQDRPVGYAQLTRGAGGRTLEFVVDPRDQPSLVAEDLVRAAVDLVGREGGGHLQLWVRDAHPEHDRIASAAGLAQTRDMYQMRRPLPVDEPWELSTRPFRPGVDDEAWLAVNNRAFDWHPEQGGWDVARLKAREAEPWFDAEGFLLHWSAGRLAGFCWTKIHTENDPPLGEIYVIAVDPDFQGTGLGRRLVLAGLDYLWRKGMTVGMLYVDATNRPAVKLYHDLGFEIDHIDRAYSGAL
ncbi:MAG TPA: mycothiol synthase [Acidimicrobiales bacterium]|nr:mycothiol synthase [Acidimicrobiales bacterium]